MHTAQMCVLLPFNGLCCFGSHFRGTTLFDVVGSSCSLAGSNKPKLLQLDFR